MRVLLLFLLACGTSPDLADSDAELSTALGGGLSLLTFNVAGLPDGLSASEPKTNTPVISPLLNAFDVALVQEDFWYHDALISQAHHPYKSAPYLGDGLNQLSVYPFSHFERDAWEACHGYLRCDSDCLAKKGFTYSVLHLPGADVNLFNLHMDAGTCAGDREARWSQLMQVADYINLFSGPTIVAGDTNLYEEDSLAAFVRYTGLTDACAWDRIDRIFVRGLSAGPCAIAQSFDGLSDHRAVTARVY